MKIFYSNLASCKGIEQYLGKSLNVLISYYGLKILEKPLFCKNLFLDSGAYSAYRKGIILDPIRYSNFIKNNIDQVFIYAGLDVIGDPKETWKNQKIIEREGLNPLPCFHYGEPFKWLNRYCSEYDFIAIGGAAIISQDKVQLTSYFDNCWDIISKVNPNMKIHGFGLQNEMLMQRYPWYSVDSSSIHLIARYGGIYTPWGSFKINPEVNKKELKWGTPKKLEVIENWVKSLNLSFTLDEAKNSNTDSILKRCVISITYFENKYNNFKCNFINNNNSFNF